MRAMVCLVLILVGCNANSGEQSLARFDPRVDSAIHATATAAATLAAEASIKGLEASLVQTLDDRSQRLTKSVQEAVVAVNKTDNSTADKVVNRMMAAGYVVLAIGAIAVPLVYPIGKLLWLATGGVGSRIAAWRGTP